MGNKADLDNEREVQIEEGAGLALEGNYKFKETSCRKNQNVAGAFEALIELWNMENQGKNCEEIKDEQNKDANNNKKNKKDKNNKKEKKDKKDKSEKKEEKKEKEEKENSNDNSESLGETLESEGRISIRKSDFNKKKKNIRKFC